MSLDEESNSEIAFDEPSSGYETPAYEGPSTEEIAEQRAYILHQARQHREVVLGMGMEDVRAVWGEPRSVDVAGEGSSGNQRWVYYEGLSGPGSMSNARIIYFENGEVAGWDTR